MLVLASLAVPRLTLVCVCACSCLGVSISYVESLKFEGGAMVDMVPRQYFHLRKCTCSGVQRREAVEGEAVQSIFSRFSRCSTVMSTECAVFFAVHEPL